MGFEGLDEAAGDQQDGDATSGRATTTGENEESAAGGRAEQVREQSDPREEPAFEFDQSSMQDNVYVRESTQDAWGDAKQFDVERILKQDHGVRNVQGRELDDAMVRLAADHPELVAAYVMDARGVDLPEELATRLPDELGE